MTRPATHHRTPALVTLLLLACCVVVACGEEPAAEKPADVADADGLETLDPRTGRYRLLREQPAAGGVDRAELERLAAIGYLEGTREAHASEGVVQHDPERSDDGLNLYVSAHAPEATLMDMDGRVLHRWRRPSTDIWPGPQPPRKGGRYFRRAYPMEDGSLLVIFAGLGIAKLDVDSKVIWAAPAEGSEKPVAHHDLEIQPNGDILALTRFPRLVEWINRKHPILDDFITLYGPDGEKKKQISLAEAFERSVYREVILDNRKKRGDIFHTNSIQSLDGSVAHVNPRFGSGNILLSMRHMSLLAVLDPKEQEIVWARRGPYEQQHDAEVLANGNLLLFDNGPSAREDSRAIELDPGTLALRWEYAGSEAEPLWSKTCGTVQRLGNGNTLVVESDNGRAIEVTRDGDVVWEFVNANRAGDQGDLVATLFDVIRLPADQPIPWAKGDALPARAD